jgi:hypothetical protein
LDSIQYLYFPGRLESDFGQHSRKQEVRRGSTETYLNYASAA